MYKLKQSLFIIHVVFLICPLIIIFLTTDYNKVHVIISRIPIVSSFTSNLVESIISNMVSITLHMVSIMDKNSLE